MSGEPPGKTLDVHLRFIFYRTVEVRCPGGGPQGTPAPRSPASRAQARLRRARTRGPTRSGQECTASQLGAGPSPAGQRPGPRAVRGSLGGMVHAVGALPLYIPSPPINSFHIGPLLVRFYALGYIIGITLAILITRRRWRAAGGDPALVGDIALWAVPAGIIGGRIYF